MTRRPDPPSGGDPPRRPGALLLPHRALRPMVATVALLGVVLAACSPNQAASRPANNAGAAAPKAGATTGVQIGQVAPAFGLTTIEGKPLTSADLRAQEKPYILYFFATW